MNRLGKPVLIASLLLGLLWMLLFFGLPYGTSDWTAYSQPYVTDTLTYTPTASATSPRTQTLTATPTSTPTIGFTITLTPTPTRTTTVTALVYLPLIRRPLPFRPVIGSVEIEAQGGCCYSSTISVPVRFGATSPFAEVTEMRVQASDLPNDPFYGCDEDWMANIPWKPFVSEKEFSVTISAHVGWLGVGVQYRDALGYLSRVYCDQAVFIYPTITAAPTPTATAQPQF